MEVVRLSENIYEIKTPLWCWSTKKSLIEGLQEIQSYGKTVNVVRCFTTGWTPTFVVVTS